MGHVYYRSFSSYLKERFGEKVYRVSLDAGFTCPNRDGTKGYGGCAYCSPAGSWNREISQLQLHQQVQEGKQRIKKRYGAQKYIAYFQAYTNTYAPVEKLKKIYDSVVMDDDFVGIAIGTRPDCIDKEKLSLIASYKRTGREVWIEYGLQTANENTLRLINRQHGIKTFAKAVTMTKTYGIYVSAHVIIGLPDEGREDSIHTASFLAGLPIDGIKIHNLNIIKNTLMAKWYRERKVQPLSMDTYADCVVDFVERLNPTVIVQRLVAESDPRYLIAPLCSMQKQRVLRCIHDHFARRSSYQGKLFSQGVVFENPLSV